MDSKENLPKKNSNISLVNHKGESQRKIYQDTHKEFFWGGHKMAEDIVDILGRPNKHFYKGLARFATDEKEKVEKFLPFFSIFDSM